MAAPLTFPLRDSGRICGPRNACRGGSDAASDLRRIACLHKKRNRTSPYPFTVHFCAAIRCQSSPRRNPANAPLRTWSPLMPAPPKTHPQSRPSRGWPRHPLPARDQGDAERDADRRRSPRHPARGRRGEGRRHRAFRLRHRPQQGRHRGPFRQPVRARADARRAREDKRAGGAPRRPARRRPDELHASAAPLGLGHAVWCARDIVGDEPFALLLPDMLHHGGKAVPGRHDRSLQRERRQPHRRRAGARGSDPPIRHRRRRGCQGQGLAHHADGREAGQGTAPSNLHITGRYILQPEIFELLAKQERGAGGEIQLTDA